MALFQFKWLRRMVRRNMKPVRVQKAVNWKQRLSVVYMLVAWNAVGFVAYYAATGRGDWAAYYGLKKEEDTSASPALKWARALKLEKVDVVRVSGFSKVSEAETLTLPKSDESQELNPEEESTT